MQRHFQMLADYNRWANARIYDACAALPDADYRADRGAFFGSAHRTLNHLLVADRIWLRRITGNGVAPMELNVILHDDLSELRRAREAEDRRFIDLTASFGPEDFERLVHYTPVTVPEPMTEPLGVMLAHVFNHQTHHRGQVHTILTSLGQSSVVLDMIAFLRADGRQWMTSRQH
ncbi:DinB family protein [Rhizobium sp. S152]|uniref:DinB family protein n=1 Tax=Rhizobium sp. S152 TaxID=3055038 RepID=UPI0025A968BA|nr:DinB family protein [Rhizobium sp. S152]MDM9629230.1 DinB family protein [Rhizobium sp. S152]